MLESQAGKGYRSHPDMLKFASLSHRLRDIVFDGNKPTCKSMPFYRSAGVACKWMRQDLLNEINLARLEIDWTLLSYTDSRMGFINCFINYLERVAEYENGTGRNPSDQFADFGFSHIPQYMVPSVTSLQIKTQEKPWQRNRDCKPEYDDPSATFWMLFTNTHAKYLKSTLDTFL